MSTAPKKKTSTKAAAPAEGKAVKKKTAAKADKPAKTNDLDGYTTINELAAEFKTSTRQVRIILRKAGIPKPEGFRYAWKPDSKDLKAVRSAIEKGMEPNREV